MFLFSVPIAFSLTVYPLDMNIRLQVNLEGKYKNPFCLLIWMNSNNMWINLNKKEISSSENSATIEEKEFAEENNKIITIDVYEKWKTMNKNIIDDETC